MGGLGSKLMAWIGGAASLGLAAALAFVWISKGAEVRALTVANSNLANDLSQSRLNASRLEGAVAIQSAAIDRLAAAGELREARLANALDHAAIASSGAQRAAAGILARKPEGDHCLAADRLILEVAGK